MSDFNHRTDLVVPRNIEDMLQILGKELELLRSDPEKSAEKDVRIQLIEDFLSRAKQAAEIMNLLDEFASLFM